MKIILIIIFSYLIQFNIVNANTKIVFVDLDKIISTSIPGLSVINQLKKINSTNTLRFNNDAQKLKKKETKLISQKNIISETDFQSQVNKLKLEVKNYNTNRNKIINDFKKLRIDNTNKLLELINPIQQVITGYTYVTSYPIGSDCAHSYYRSTTSGSWTSEKAKAQAAGGDLLVYNSQEEFDFMVPGFAAGVGGTWIGLSQDLTAIDYVEPAGGWYWEDGTKMDNSASKLKYQITIALNGIADGDELVSINPVTAPASIFNCAGVSAINQINGTNQVYLNDKLDPYIVSSSISDDNTTVRVIFNETIFTDALGNPMLNTDFVLSLLQNGSVASLSSINPSSIINYGNRIFDLILPMIGLPMSGKEVLTILPALGSVFDAASNTASSTQINNTVGFNPPKTGPIYLSNIYKTSTVSGTLAVASETFLCDGITFTNYNQAYHDGVVLEPQVGNHLIYNKKYSYPSVLIQGSNFGYYHLRVFDVIIEIRKSDGLIVAKYSCL